MFDYCLNCCSFEFRSTAQLAAARWLQEDNVTDQEVLPRPPDRPARNEADYAQAAVDSRFGGCPRRQVHRSERASGFESRKQDRHSFVVEQSRERSDRVCHLSGVWKFQHQVSLLFAFVRFARHA